MSPARVTFVLLYLAAIPSAVIADEHAVPRARSVSPPDTDALPLFFSSSAILGRFDANKDSRLDASEQAAVRAAMGGVDIPIVPWPPLKYHQIELPAHFQRAKLDELDNTPVDNPLTDAGATLGRVLFYDRQLSRSNTVACASCHLQKFGFADPRRFSEGFAGGHTQRNGMALTNLRYTNVEGQRPGFFWDERAPSLEAQVLMPIQDNLEMGMELPVLERKLQALSYYPPLFQKAFGSTQVTSANLAKALAQFLRSIVSAHSRFDHEASQCEDVYLDFQGFTKQENLGKKLFFDGVDGFAEFACAMCHVPPTFTMPGAMNIGLDRNYVDPGLGALSRPSTDPFSPSNDGKFKAPSLRNIAITAPYMHDGRFKTLDEVLKHYSEGVQRHPNLSLAFREEGDKQAALGFGFSDEEKAALIAFLKTLTDDKLISDERFSDPFVRAEEESKKE